MSAVTVVIPALLVATLCAGCDPATTTAQDTGNSTPPMPAFIETLRNRDTTRFLSFFSRTQSWRYISTLDAPPMVSEVMYAELESDLRARTGWYETLFDNDGDDCFRDWFEGPEGSNWKQTSPTRFVRRTTNGQDRVYVEWQREGSRWVIQTIAEPSA